MKKGFIIPVLAFWLGACNNNKAEREAEIERATAVAIDSLNDMNERIRIEDSMESLSDATVSPAIPEKSGTRKTTKREQEPVAGKREPVEAPSPDDEKTAGTGTVNAGKEDETSPAGTDTVAADPETKKKKGINNTVKSAVIGAGAGAVGGAIINKKNPGKGAIIGGVIGAGAGAVTGVIIDKSKKKKAAKDTSGVETTTKEPDTKP